MQPSRNFDDLKFSSIHRRILLWGSGGPFLDGYVLVMIGVALEQLTPALKLDADWIGLLGAGTLAGLFVGTSLFGYISDKVGRRKMFLIDIIAIGVISVATMFVSSPIELLVMRVLIGIVIGVAILTLLRAVPYLGGLIVFASIIYTVGYFVLHCYENIKALKKQPEEAPAEAEEAAAPSIEE